MSGSKRIFTFEEARRLLPAVRERTRQALDALAALENGGREERDEARRRAGGGIFEAWVRDVEALGIEVKGPWLVDFDSGAGYYCWRWPEESLDFYHGYEEGFSGRVRIQ